MCSLRCVFTTNTQNLFFVGFISEHNIVLLQRSLTNCNPSSVHLIPIWSKLNLSIVSIEFTQTWVINLFENPKHFSNLLFLFLSSQFRLATNLGTNFYRICFIEFILLSNLFIETRFCRVWWKGQWNRRWWSSVDVNREKSSLDDIDREKCSGQRQRHFSWPIVLKYMLLLWLYWKPNQ